MLPIVALRCGASLPATKRCDNSAVFSRVRKAASTPLMDRRTSSRGEVQELRLARPSDTRNMHGLVLFGCCSVVVTSVCTGTGPTCPQVAKNRPTESPQKRFTFVELSLGCPIFSMLQATRNPSPFPVRSERSRCSHATRGRARVALFVFIRNDRCCGASASRANASSRAAAHRGAAGSA